MQSIAFNQKQVFCCFIQERTLFENINLARKMIIDSNSYSLSDSSTRSPAALARRKLLEQRTFVPRVTEFLSRIATAEGLSEGEKRCFSPIHEALLTTETILLEGFADVVAANTDSIESLDLNGFAPLHLAVLRHDQALMRVLLSEGANPDLGDSLDKSPLHLATETASQDTSLVQLLLDAGANPDTRDWKGNTPLHNAAAKGLPNCVSLLISYGADVNICNLWSEATPLNLLAETCPQIPGHAEIFEILKESGADLELSDVNNGTPLMNAIKNPDGVRLFMLLIEAGARLDPIDSHGMSILHRIALWGSTEMMEYLETSNFYTILDVGNCHRREWLEVDRPDRRNQRPENLFASRSSNSTLYYTNRTQTELECNAFQNLIDKINNFLADIDYLEALDDENDDEFYDCVSDINILSGEVYQAPTQKGASPRESGEGFREGSERPEIIDNSKGFQTRRIVETPDNDAKVDVVQNGDESDEIGEPGTPISNADETDASLPSEAFQVDTVESGTQTDDLPGDNISWDSIQTRIVDDDGISDAGSDSTAVNSTIASSITMTRQPSELQATLNQVFTLFSEHTEIPRLLQTACQDEFLGFGMIDRSLRQAFRIFAKEFSYEGSQFPQMRRFLDQYCEAISFSLLISSVQRTDYSIKFTNMELGYNNNKEGGDGFSIWNEEGSATGGIDEDETQEVAFEGPEAREELLHLPDFSDELFCNLFLGSKAVSRLLDRLRSIADPSFLPTANRLIAQTITAETISPEEASTLKTQLMSLVVELDHSKPTELIINTENDITRGDMIKTAMEDMTRETWQWWPLAQPRRPLKPGHVRLVWNCVSEEPLRGDKCLVNDLVAQQNCGHTRFAAVPEGFAHKLAQLIQKYNSTSPTIHIPAPAALRQSAQASHAISSGTQPPAALPSDPPVVGSPAPTTAAAPASTITSPEESQKRKFIFLMVNRDRLRLHQVNSTNQGTERFAKELREGYRKLRGFWRFWFSVYAYSHCDFVKFEKFCPSVFAHRGHSLPDKEPHAEDYFYKPRPAQSPAPISPEEFTHIYYNYRSVFTFKLNSGRSRHTLVAQGPWYWPRVFTDTPPLFVDVKNSQLPPDTVLRIPQRFKFFDELGAAREELWGLHAREKRSALRVFFVVVLTLLPWLAFCFVYLFGLGGKTVDIQNATTPLTISITSLGLFLAWLVK
ncbi:Ankyrin-3 [Paramyrothecium foliicola]|nr:Ankyrin-3 [Paramyrothecium foliicola]